MLKEKVWHCKQGMTSFSRHTVLGVSDKAHGCVNTYLSILYEIVT